MFKNFNIKFKPDAESIGWNNNSLEHSGIKSIYEQLPKSYFEFLTQTARSSYSGGLIRFLLPQTNPSLLIWNAPNGWISDWEKWGRKFVFAYDWLGRQISLDFTRVENNEPLVTILEPGTGEMLEVPENFEGFLERELIDYSDAALASNFFNEWKNKEKIPLEFNKCVGYKTPLFLGGQDTLENLEVSDIEVYVSLCGQLYSGIS
ncbi:MAG: DUF1851 domain-containing protein [Pyrinomonadaceae bacterium]|nr:DUF1851 domain-containing protein [Pyrinomonadaceae bacterium]